MSAARIDPAYWNEVYLKTEGFLQDVEARLLYALARREGPAGEIVEIGSWKGKSTVILARALQDGHLPGKVHAVDPHRGSPEHGQVWTFDEFKKNIERAGVAGRVSPIVKTSEEAARGWSGPIRFLWIDGNHEYDFVKTDFTRWEPFLAEGGTVAFHDCILAEGVNRFLREALFSSAHYRRIRFLGNIVYAEKAASISLPDRLGNRFSLAAWSLYGAYSQRKWTWPRWLKLLLKPFLPRR